MGLPPSYAGLVQDRVIELRVVSITFGNAGGPGGSENESTKKLHNYDLANPFAHTHKVTEDREMCMCSTYTEDHVHILL